MKTLLSIAGFDPTSGAGINKDIEIFSSLGFHGIGIPTSLVIQGPSGVKSMHGIPCDLFKQMLKSIEDEGIELSGLKTGVLVNDEYVKSLVFFIKEKNWNKPIVVDPVLRAKNGYPLLDQNGIRLLKDSLIPICTVLTPNKEEAEILTGMGIKSVKDMRDCAKKLMGMGAKTVVMKGGHAEGELLDIFYDGDSFLEKKKVRLERVVHGTGCMFSSVLLCFLALGFRPQEAFLETENFMDILLREAYSLTEKGYMYSSLSMYWGQLARRFEVLSALREVKERLERLNPVDLIPEVQMNLCYAIPSARGIEDVCAYPGRISKYGNKVLVKSDPEFGASSHVARSLLSFMKFYPHVRSCANVRYSKEFVENARKNGLHIVYFDRKVEPQATKKEEGKSLDFLVENVLKKTDSIPDIIYDEGDVGKEPMMRVFARDPFELLDKMEKLLR